MVGPPSLKEGDHSPTPTTQRAEGGTVTSSTSAPTSIRRCAVIDPLARRCEETVDLWARPGGGLICPLHLRALDARCGTPETGKAPPAPGADDWRGPWDVAGLASGHAWTSCDVCGREALLPRARKRKCHLTPNCRGRIRPPADRPTPLQALKAALISADDIRRNPPPLTAALRRLLEKGGTDAVPG